MGLIYHLSAQSDPGVPSFLLWNDKITHFFEYALLGLLLIRALKKEYFKFNLTGLKLIALLIAAAYGASDEFHQGFIIGRKADFFDWLVDFYGSAFGSFCILIPGDRPFLSNKERPKKRMLLGAKKSSNY